MDSATGRPQLGLGSRLLLPPLLFMTRLAGWKIEGAMPPVRRCVLVAAPHTSNWDFPLMLAVAWSFGVQIHWMGKKSLFAGIMGPFARALGGVPVDRSQTTDAVNRMAAEFARRSDFVLVIPPQGSRRSRGRWRTGYYHIARTADVPIVLGYLDYGRKVGGIGPMIQPSGDHEADEIRIRAFYAGIRARHPERLAHPDDPGPIEP